VEEERLIKDMQQIEAEIPRAYLTCFERYALHKATEESRQEGRQEGLATGRKEGLQNGLLFGWIEALKASASVRFPDLDPSWEQHLETVEDADLLKDWHRLLMTAPSGEEFLKAIGKQPR
jgi:predicted transposase YdaD